MLTRLRRGIALVAVIASILVLAACTGATGPDLSGPPVTLRVLAGSELADMAPVLDRAAAATGVRVEMRYTGSLSAVDEVASGRADPTTDAVWFSSTRYLDLDARARERLGSSTPIMTSPVVLGLRRSSVARLGWDRRPVGWGDIATAAGRGEFTFGMTDPSESNSGFSALVGVTAAADGSGRAPDLAAIERAAPQLTAMFRGQAQTAGSSAYLIDTFVDRMAGRAPGPPIDGIVNYESVLQTLNRSGRLSEPLIPIYPTDGAVSADYPLAALASISPQARDGYTRLITYLTSPDAQRDIAGTTLRRPGVAAADLAPAPDQPPVVELPFPGSRAVIEALVDAYFDRFRRPVRSSYVVDVSGSMEGPRIAALRAALVGLATGTDPAQGVRSREDLTLLPFSTTPSAPQRFVVDPATPDVGRAAIRTASERLTAGGDTAIYDAVIAAYRDLLARRGGNARITTIVLMTDGENRRGADVTAFSAFLAGLPPEDRGVPVFPVLFGESSVPGMTEIAAVTGGKVFDARTTPLPEIFRQIRGYQ